MRQKISISRWNIGEASQRSIGDFDQALYPSTCRILNNFVVSETGKLWRRPGFTHHVEITHDDVRLIPFYKADDSYVLALYYTGTNPTQVLTFDWYKLVSDKFVLQDTEVVYTHAADDFLLGRPIAVDLKKISYVQVNDVIYITSRNMEDPHQIVYNATTDSFTASNFSTYAGTFYYDIDYATTKWTKTTEFDLTAGGGNADGGGDAGWTAYTGKEFTTGNTPAQTFKYLGCVTFSFERLVFAVEARVHGTASGDLLGLGLQYNGNIPTTVDIDPYVVLASDPFVYQASSDLGYENFAWLAGGSLLMGGANNGAWVLSNAQAGGLDATDPLMYRSSSNGCHWVPGKTIGDAMIFFQRPGRQLNEFLFANASQNYVATNLSEFSDHLFYDSIPVELHVQRSPFNVAWIVREDGVLISFTYDRQRQMYAWARHDFTQTVNKDTPVSNGIVKSMTMYSDGVVDRPVIYTKRTSGGVDYYGLEMMDFYTPEQIDGVFVDAAVEETLKGSTPIVDILEDAVNGHWIYYDETNATYADDDILRINDATRTDDGVQPVADNHYDYIYGVWTVFDHDGVLFRFRMKDQTGEPYKGIWENGSLFVVIPATENAYINYGTAFQVTDNPLAASVPDYAHLKNVYCKALMDGNPKYIYISSDGTTFFNADTIPDDWDGNEAELDDNLVYWNKIIIGRPYDSVFAPFIMKKQIKKGKLTEMEIEAFRSLGGMVGTATVTLDNELENINLVDLTYPALFEQDQLYTGTLKPQLVGGYGDDPLWFIFIDDAVPFNITNVIYFLEAN